MGNNVRANSMAMESLVMARDLRYFLHPKISVCLAFKFCLAKTVHLYYSDVHLPRQCMEPIKYLSLTRHEHPGPPTLPNSNGAKTKVEHIRTSNCGETMMHIKLKQSTRLFSPTSKTQHSLPLYLFIKMSSCQN
jgi:hypothetical protein